MTNRYNQFLNNQCIEAIAELSTKYPDNKEFGEAVRNFLEGGRFHNPNQLKLNLDLLGDSDGDDDYDY